MQWSQPISCGRAEFSSDSGCAALWQRRLLLPGQAGREGSDICSEAKGDLGQAEHSQAPVWFVCSQHSHWGRGTWWPLAAGPAAAEQDKAEHQLQQCLLFMCDQSLKVCCSWCSASKASFACLEVKPLKCDPNKD